MATSAQIANSEYCRRYYRRNAETLRVKKRGPARAYKQRIALAQAIEAARQLLSSRFARP